MRMWTHSTSNNQPSEAFRYSAFTIATDIFSLLPGERVNIPHIYKPTNFLPASNISDYSYAYYYKSYKTKSIYYLYLWLGISTAFLLNKLLLHFCLFSNARHDAISRQIQKQKQRCTKMGASKRGSGNIFSPPNSRIEMEGQPAVRFPPKYSVGQWVRRPFIRHCFMKYLALFSVGNARKR